MCRAAPDSAFFRLQRIVSSLGVNTITVFGNSYSRRNTKSRQSASTPVFRCRSAVDDHRSAPPPHALPPLAQLSKTRFSRAQKSVLSIFTDMARRQARLATEARKGPASALGSPAAAKSRRKPENIFDLVLGEAPVGVREPQRGVCAAKGLRRLVCNHASSTHAAAGGSPRGRSPGTFEAQLPVRRPPVEGSFRRHPAGAQGGFSGPRVSYGRATASRVGAVSRSSCRRADHCRRLLDGRNFKKQERR